MSCDYELCLTRRNDFADNMNLLDYIKFYSITSKLYRITISILPARKPHQSYDTSKWKTSSLEE